MLENLKREIWSGINWEARGEYQLDLLKGFGMQPHHKLADIGCGLLRAGTHFIKYLDKGCYFGMDHDRRFIPVCSQIVEADEELSEKKPRFYLLDNFSFQKTSMPIVDFGMVFSVIQHFPKKDCPLFFQNVSHIMHDKTRIFISHSPRVNNYAQENKDSKVIKKYAIRTLRNLPPSENYQKGWSSGSDVLPFMEIMLKQEKNASQ